MSPRGEKESPKVASPTQTAFGLPATPVQSSASHDFYLQTALHTERSIGGLENAVKTLTETSNKHDDKLDRLLSDVDQAKGSLTTFKWVFGLVVPVGTAVGVVLLEAVLKHFRVL